MFVPYVNKNWPQIYMFYTDLRVLLGFWTIYESQVIECRSFFFSFKLSQAISTEKESLVLVAEPIL